MTYKEMMKTMNDAEVCFGSLVYCCALRKSCPYRDKAIAKLGLTRRDYSQWKRLMNHNLLTYLQAKGGEIG